MSHSIFIRITLPLPILVGKHFVDFNFGLDHDQANTRVRPLNSITIRFRAPSPWDSMVFVCPNIHCGQVFPSPVGVSNHVRSRKCKDAKAKAAASAKRHGLENEEELADPRLARSTGKRRRIEESANPGRADENVQPQEPGPSSNQPENLTVPEVALSFDRVKLKLIYCSF
jgi:hypothetical protein